MSGRRPFLQGVGALGVAGSTVGLAGCLGDVDDVGDGEEPVDLVMASFREGTGWYVMVSAIGDAVGDYLPAGSQVSVRPFGGSQGSIELLRDGDVDTAVNHPVTTQWAMNQEEIFSDAPAVDNLRGIAGHLDTYWTLLGLEGGFAEEHGIESYEDMIEAEPAITIGLGPEGGVSNQGTLHELEAHGITPDDIESWGGSLEYMGLGDMPTAIQSGTIDAVGWVATPGHPTWTEIATNANMVFMPSTDEGMATMAERGWLEMPPMPEGEFENDREIPSVGWRTTLIATDELADNVAYALAQTLVEEQESLTSAYAALEVYDPELGATEEFLGVELHPGAREYYEEEGLL